MKPIATFSLLTSLILSAACASSLSAAAPPAPPNPQPQPGPGPRNRPTITLNGKILSFNRNPRGEAEGLMLDTAQGLVQINMPFEISEQIKKIPPGDAVEATVVPDNGPPDQPNLNGAGPNGPPNGQFNNQGGPGGQGAPQGGPGGPGGQRGGPGGRGPGRGPRGGQGNPGGPNDQPPQPGPGNTFFSPLPDNATTFVAQPPSPPSGNQAPGGRGPRGGGPNPNGPNQNVQPNNNPGPSDHPIFQLISLRDSKGNEFRGPPRQPLAIESTLKAFNYGPRGAINGLQLANGDFVRINPNNGNLGLKPNDKVAVDGMALTLPDGSHMIDPQLINGQPSPLGPPNPPNDFQNGPNNQGPNNQGPNPNGPGPRGQGGPGGRGARRGGQGPNGPPPDANIP